MLMNRDSLNISSHSFPKVKIRIHLKISKIGCFRSYFVEEDACSKTICENVDLFSKRCYTQIELSHNQGADSDQLPAVSLRVRAKMDSENWRSDLG